MRDRTSCSNSYSPWPKIISTSLHSNHKQKSGLNETVIVVTYSNGEYFLYLYIHAGLLVQNRKLSVTDLLDNEG